MMNTIDRRTTSLPYVTLVALTLMLASTTVFADEDPIYTSFFSNVAVGGYDPVAYFEEGRPIEGDAMYSLQYKGAEFRFSSEQNLTLFRANPEDYAPQYGGYCAWAVSQGNLAKGDPDHWKIVDGKLYLNYSKSIQQRWEKNIPGFIATADLNWPNVLE
ncbi:MAG: YHS domain-containing (seleno)protein [Pseudomonadota bacterium]